MIPFGTLLFINKDAATPVYQQIANGLTGLIRDGVIKPGATIPGSREMAALLHVHRKTVVAAYQELYAQDWIETIPRKGVYVSQHLPEIRPRTFKAVAEIPAYAGHTGFSFNRLLPFPSMPHQQGEHGIIINDGFPDHRIAPIDVLMREYRSLAHKRYAPHSSMTGSLRLRTELVQFLSDTRGLSIGTHNILLTHGAQMAIYIAAKLLLKPGSTVLVGESNYFMADMIFQQAGAKLVRVPLDENGMDVDAIEKICKKKKPDLLYIIPHHHHPTTVTLSADRRMKLLALIRKYKLPVIEDDYDYDFHYNSSPILPLASAGHDGNVIYIGSLTKSLATFLRVGYMIAPENFIQAAAQVRRLIDIRSDTLLEDSLAALFRNGDMQRHLKKSVKRYHEKRDLLCDLLDDQLKHIVTFHKPAGGMAVWAQFHKKHPLPAIAARAAVKGLMLGDGSTYSYGTINHNALRIGFASLDEQEMREAIRILKQVTT